MTRIFVALVVFLALVVDVAVAEQNSGTDSRSPTNHQERVEQVGGVQAQGITTSILSRLIENVVGGLLVALWVRFFLLGYHCEKYVKGSRGVPTIVSILRYWGKPTESKWRIRIWADYLLNPCRWLLRRDERVGLVIIGSWIAVILILVQTASAYLGCR